MPSLDRLIQIAEPTGQRVVTFDYGHGLTSWYPYRNKIRGKDSRKRAVAHQGGPIIRAQDVIPGLVTTYDRFALAEDANNPECSWGARPLPDRAISPDRKAAAALAGFVIGAPQGADVSALEGSYVGPEQFPAFGTVALRFYVDQTDPRQLMQVGDPFALLSIGRLAEGVYDLRLDAARVPADPDADDWQRRIYGVQVEVTLSMAENITAYWARVVQSAGVVSTVDVGDGQADSIIQTRTYEIRHTDKVGVFSQVLADGETWEVTAVDEIGRRRYMRLECERTVRRDG